MALLRLLLIPVLFFIGTTEQAPADALNQTIDSRTSNMTLSAALQAVGHRFRDDDLLALVQMGNGRHHRKHHHLRTGSSNVAEAMVKLNAMIVESGKKMDLEDIKCSQYIDSQTELIEEVRQDISAYNAMGAAARAHILQAKTTIGLIQAKLPQVKSDVQEHDAKCRTDMAALNAQLRILEEDATTMGTILGLLDCPVTMLQCGAPGRDVFSHRALRSKISQLRSSHARRHIQALIDHTYRHRRQVPAMNTTDEPNRGKANRKCSIASSPSCVLLRDRFLDINADMMDKIDEFEENIAKTSNECEETKENFEAQIKDFETRLKVAQTDLAEATETQNQAEEQSRLKSAQLIELQKDLAKEKKRCKGSISNLRNEICGLKRIRQELLKIKSQPIFIQDCAVSKWTPQECSATCGGGVQKLTRTITMPALGGAGCPPLEMEQQCGMKPCPVDCQVSSWSGWSACSAKCGGGVMQRTRGVIREAQHGGEPCGETSITESCNIQSCDRACELKKWTSWSACSKACGGGFQNSVRKILRKPQGQGKCPSRRSKLRKRFKKCNKHACKPAPDKPTLRCKAKLDVIILLDGSASLGSAGWEATKVMGKMLVNAFQGSGSQVGVILFSGPTTSGSLMKCFQGRQKDLGECGVEWVEHFTVGDAKLASLAAKVEGLQWPRATTMTSVALATAENELRMGRADVNSLVMVVTDGRPMSTRKTFQASRSLRQKARLMWVPVGQAVPIPFLKKCASQPVRDNIMIVKDFEGMKAPETINAIIADACPMVG